LIFAIQNVNFGPGNNNQDLLSKNTPSWPGYLIFSKKSIFRFFPKKPQILIFFQHMGLNIQEYQKINVLGNFDDMRVSISENIQKIDFSGIFTKILFP
jgi:hypothetical protein